MVLLAEYPQTDRLNFKKNLSFRCFTGDRKVNGWHFPLFSCFIIFLILLPYSGVDYIKKLQAEKSHLAEEMNLLKEEINTLNLAIR